MDCRFDDPLIPFTSAIVIAESFIRENYADRQLDDLFREYQQRASGLIIFTFGNTAIWYGRPDQTAQTFQPYSIEPVDTCGAGDENLAAVRVGDGGRAFESHAVVMSWA